MRERWLIAVVAVAMAFLGVAPCRGEQILRYNIGAEPETLDPTKATGIPESTVMLNCFDGLVRTDVSGNEIIPRAAERWTVSPDGPTCKGRPSPWSKCRRGR